MKLAQTITQESLNDLLVQARNSPRRRTPHNFHPHHNHPCHRLLNGLCPDTYIRPHCHLDPNKDETMIVLKGTIGVLFFDTNGAVTNTFLLKAGGEQLGLTIPVGQFHSLVALEDAVFLESKAGPYLALSEPETAPWAPAEQDSDAANYRERLKSYF